MEWLITLGLGLLSWSIRYRRGEPSITETLLDTTYEEMFGKSDDQKNVNPYTQQRLDEEERGERLRLKLIEYEQRKKDVNND